MQSLIRRLFAVFFFVLTSQPVHAQLYGHDGELFVKTVAPLDDPRGFCIDLPGHPVVNLDEPVQAHTCKEGYPNGDELFDPDEAGNGRLSMPAVERCLVAVDGLLMTAPCEDGADREWLFSSGGAIRPSADPSLCITIGEESSEAGYPEEVSPAWLHRDITVEPCNWRIGARQQWQVAAPKMPVLEE